MNPILSIAIGAATAGGMTSAILYGYGRGAKKGAGRGALYGGLVSAGIAATLAALGYYMVGSSDTEGVSGLGLLSVKSNRVARLGAYIPEPTVKKFSSFTGVKYYS